MSLEDVFAPYEREHKNRVMRDTWGHLAPQRKVKYPGTMVFTCSGYGGTYSLIDANFEGVEDSPWLYEAMYEYVCNKAERGVIHKFEGTCELLKNGRFRFSGKIKKIKT